MDKGVTSPKRSEIKHRPAPLFVSSRIPTPPPPLERPLQLFSLNDFILLRTLGTGTFGRVRLAKYIGGSGVEKFFAMKIMKKVEVVRLKQERHVLAERWLLSRLNFPFIVRMFGAYQDEKNLYLLLEYIIGGELYSYLRKAGRFPIGVARFYASEILLAIEYLHSFDIAYRDLKPENLLLDAKGHIKLSDFGFAKVVPERTWTLCGTPEYLAPEIIANRGHGKSVDWWALGILIYEMIAGHPPFYDHTPFGTYEKILAGNLEFDATKFDAISIDLIRRLLVADPALRLGNLRGGAQDIRSHPWFAGVDWNGLYRKSIQPPIHPRVSHPGDTNNFEIYEEEQVQTVPSSSSSISSEPTGQSRRPSKLDPFAEIFRNF
jgi:serine/threonine protein kinase